MGTKKVAGGALIYAMVQRAVNPFIVEHRGERFAHLTVGKFLLSRVKGDGAVKTDVGQAIVTALDKPPLVPGRNVITVGPIPRLGLCIEVEQTFA